MKKKGAKKNNNSIREPCIIRGRSVTHKPDETEDMLLEEMIKAVKEGPIIEPSVPECQAADEIQEDRSNWHLAARSYLGDIPVKQPAKKGIKGVKLIALVILLNLIIIVSAAYFLGVV